MNKIEAVIKEIRKKDELILIKLKSFNDTFTSLILQNISNAPFLKEGERVWMIFKESEVSLAKEGCKISLQNRFKCKIEDIKSDEILAIITLSYHNYKIKSLITSDAIKELGLKVEDSLLALVKSNELTIMEY